MFGFALVLWMIDIHNLVTVIKMTLLSTSMAPLSDVYDGAVRKTLRLASVEDVVYSYMVSNRFHVSHQSEQPLDDPRRHDHHLACVRFLVARKGETRVDRSYHLFSRLNLYVRLESFLL